MKLACSLQLQSEISIQGLKKTEQKPDKSV